MVLQGVLKETVKSALEGGPMLLWAVGLIPFELAVLLYGWLIFGAVARRDADSECDAT
jgi:hypothetical protein